MKRYLSVTVFATGVAALLAFAAFVEAGRWNECRRYHPGWYCLLDIGGR